LLVSSFIHHHRRSDLLLAVIQTGSVARPWARHKWWHVRVCVHSHLPTTTRRPAAVPGGIAALPATVGRSSCTCGSTTPGDYTAQDRYDGRSVRDETGAPRSRLRRARADHRAGTATSTLDVSRSNGQIRGTPPGSGTNHVTSTAMDIKRRHERRRFRSVTSTRPDCLPSSVTPIGPTVWLQCVAEVRARSIRIGKPAPRRDCKHRYAPVIDDT